MNLANLLKQQGERVEARSIYEIVVGGLTRQLGAEHTVTLFAKMNLANVLEQQDDLTEARRLYIHIAKD